MLKSLFFAIMMLNPQQPTLKTDFGELRLTMYRMRPLYVTHTVQRDIGRHIEVSLRTRVYVSGTYDRYNTRLTIAYTW